MDRMMRVSPPELDFELPGPHASIKVTRAPPRKRCSAVQPPNAPAPITAIRIRYWPPLSERSRDPSPFPSLLPVESGTSITPPAERKRTRTEAHETSRNEQPAQAPGSSIIRLPNCLPDS